MFRYSFKILPDRLKLIRLYPCGSLGRSISFVFGARVGHFAATPQSDVVGIWSRDLGVMATLSVQQKMHFFSCIYNPQITVSATSSFSANFDGNRVKNHPAKNAFSRINRACFILSKISVFRTLLCVLSLFLNASSQIYDLIHKCFKVQNNQTITVTICIEYFFLLSVVK